MVERRTWGRVDADTLTIGIGDRVTCLVERYGLGTALLKIMPQQHGDDVDTIALYPEPAFVYGAYMPRKA